MKKLYWCQHIKAYKILWPFWLKRKYVWVFMNNYHITENNWELCPICGAKNPEKETK